MGWVTLRLEKFSNRPRLVYIDPDSNLRKECNQQILDIRKLRSHLGLLLCMRNGPIQKDSLLADVVILASNEALQEAMFRLMDYGVIRPQYRVRAVLSLLAEMQHNLEIHLLC